jgi:hypothetical protein
MRMLGPKGSPSAANLSSILTALQKTEGIQFELSLRCQGKVEMSYSQQSRNVLFTR